MPTPSASTIAGRYSDSTVSLESARSPPGRGSSLLKARRSGHDTAGTVLASDGFFPFGDWVEPARRAGITAAIQPGGSVRDPESIAACDQAGLALVMTGRRLFRH